MQDTKNTALNDNLRISDLFRFIIRMIVQGYYISLNVPTSEHMHRKNTPFAPHILLRENGGFLRVHLKYTKTNVFKRTIRETRLNVINVTVVRALRYR